MTKPKTAGANAGAKATPARHSKAAANKGAKPAAQRGTTKK